MSERVAVLGGGVAGLTAAHELAERGFEVAGQFLVVDVEVVFVEQRPLRTCGDVHRQL